MKRALFVILLSTLLFGCGGGGGGSSNPAPDLVDDADGDGLSDSDETEIHGSDPKDPDDPVRFGNYDHDGDGTANGADADYDGEADDDNDGLSNDWEYSQNLNPSSAQILVTEQRIFTVVTTERSTLKLTLKTPAGVPIANTAFQVAASDPNLLRPIYPAKGWVSNNEGIIEESIIALGTGRSDLILTRADGSGTQLVIADIDSALVTTTQDPSDEQRTFSSIKNDSTPGSGNARSTLESGGAWIPATKTGTEWIELPVNQNTRVAALYTQGSANTSNWVSEIKISYEITPGFREYANSGKVFEANTDRNSLVRIAFGAPAGIDKIRIHPVDWNITPALRVGLEISSDSQPAAINTDSDGDGFSDLLEQRIGSDADDATSPRLFNPAASDRVFSSVEAGTALGDDGADGQVGANAWRSADDDTAPWMNISVPSDSKLVGVSLQGDENTNRWVSAIRYADSSVPGLVEPILNDEPQTANSDANSIANQWLTDNQSVKTLRLKPITWHTGMGMRAGLWVIDSAGISNADPLLSDTDGDGLSTLQEQALGLDSNNADIDSDLLNDGEEITVGANPLAVDTDQDGLDDKTEQLLGTDPGDANSPGLGDNQDPDGDGLTSAFEMAVLDTDPTNPDSDGDGLGDKQESFETLTDPLNADTDGDTLSDGEEFIIASNPNVASSPIESATHDADADGANAAREFIGGSDPDVRDTDGDGLLDGQEYADGSDPLDADSPASNGGDDNDGDGLTAAQEFVLATSDTDPDSPVAHGDQDLDNDGTANAADPDYRLSGDYDGDGIENQAEYDAASDPGDSDSPLLGGAFDRDGDSTPNGADTDFILQAADDSDGDGLTDETEYLTGTNATNANIPWLSGQLDIDADSTPNAIDPDYDPLSDDDSDSWSNSFEYRSGTNPDIANLIIDFTNPTFTLASPATAVIQKYNLEPIANTAPYYVANPHILASVSIADRFPLEVERDIYSGFNSDDIEYEVLGGQAMLLNNTPRRLKNLALRNSSTGEVTRILGEAQAFSRSILSDVVANAVVIEPNPLGKLNLESFQAVNKQDDSRRVMDELIDDYQRLVIGHKLMLNTPAVWQSYNDYSSSGCSSDICSSAATASESLAKMLYQDKSITHALLDDDSAYAKITWQNGQAQKADDLDRYETFHQARASSLGMQTTNGMATGFASTMDSINEYTLNDATARGTTWSEQGSYYNYSTNSATRSIRLTVYSTLEPNTLYAFSETPATELSSLTYEADTGEFVFVLTAAQWATGRIAIALQTAESKALPTMLLQWAGTQATWTD